MCANASRRAEKVFEFCFVTFSFFIPLKFYFPHSFLLRKIKYTMYSETCLYKMCGVCNYRQGSLYVMQ